MRGTGLKVTSMGMGGPEEEGGYLKGRWKYGDW